MGEFLPVVAEVLSTTHRSFARFVLHKADAQSPFNRFYDELGLRVMYDHHTPNAALDLPRWDDKRLPDPPKAKRAVQWLRKWAGDTPRRDASPRVLVQLRRDDPFIVTYFLKHQFHLPKNQALQGKRKTYGTARRNVPNLASEVVPALVRHVPSAHVEPVWDDGKTLREQIQQYLNADVLVLGHGAGMVHSLWLRNRATVIEIVPRAKMKLMVKRRTVRRATRRATQKRHKYVGQWEVDGLTLLRDIAPRSIRRITVSDAHSKVAVRKVLRCLPTTLTR